MENHFVLHEIADYLSLSSHMYVCVPLMDKLMICQGGGVMLCFLVAFVCFGVGWLVGWLVGYRALLVP
jgi:hypothetical protein